MEIREALRESSGITSALEYNTEIYIEKFLEPLPKWCSCSRGGSSRSYLGNKVGIYSQSVDWFDIFERMKQEVRNSYFLLNVYHPTSHTGKSQMINDVNNFCRDGNASDMGCKAVRWEQGDVSRCIMLVSCKDCLGFPEHWAREGKKEGYNTHTALKSLLFAAG